MGMDFFQHQDDARKNGNILVFYFVLAVIAIILSVHFATSAALFWVTASAAEGEEYAFDWLDLDRFVFFAGGTLLIVLMGSLYKMWRLSDGGHSIAQILGGHPINTNTMDPSERRVLNVVEEMSIAAGVPVPTVYLLEEEGINAFAAGTEPQDAVVGVTRGTVELLSRDELQGVIAHEFSHILNGDMRLNVRLMGVLHGILVIALIGYFVLRSSMFGGSRRRGAAAAAIPLFGLLLIIIGYLGVFFGRVIKSAVSRQREFLADASAVQFTRNPDGIGGALKKIGGLSEGSVIMSPNAEQASHLFFSDGKYGKVRAALSGVTHFDFLATHPPLKERITRIDPGWNKRFIEIDSSSKVTPEVDTKKTPDDKMKKLFMLLPLHLTALVGTLDQDHINYAKRLLAHIPDPVREAVHDPSGARAVVLALLTDRDETIRAKQMKYIEDSKDNLLLEDSKKMVILLEETPPETRLPLVDLAIPALRRLSPAQYDAFTALTDLFIRADQQADLFEYTLMHVMKRHLDPTFKATKPARGDYYSVAALAKECSYLLSAVAHAGHSDEAEAEQAFAAGAKEIEGARLRFVPRDKAGLGGVRDGLAKLERVSPKIKKALMQGVIASVAFDGKVTVGEGELLRIVADALGLPMPPFLPGQELGAANPAKAS